MIQNNLFYKTAASPAIRGVVIGVAIVAGGCATTTEGDAGASSTVEPEQVCKDGCDDNGANRYQYYLGILSVFIFG